VLTMSSSKLLGYLPFRTIALSMSISFCGGWAIGKTEVRCGTISSTGIEAVTGVFQSAVKQQYFHGAGLTCRICQAS